MRATIQFEFDRDKAVGAMAYVACALKSVDKIKLIKLLYLADRAAFLELGYPITRDRQVAMPLGPVPSRSLDLIDGNLRDHPYDFVRLEDTKVTPTAQAENATASLAAEEKQVLDAVIDQYGQKPTWDLVKLTHGFQEYRMTYQEGTSTTIPYELLLELHGDERHFRHGRPVISPRTAERMQSPFEKSEPDL